MVATNQPVTSSYRGSRCHDLLRNRAVVLGCSVRYDEWMPLIPALGRPRGRFPDGPVFNPGQPRMSPDLSPVPAPHLLVCGLLCMASSCIHPQVGGMALGSEKVVLCYQCGAASGPSSQAKRTSVLTLRFLTFSL